MKVNSFSDSLLCALVKGAGVVTRALPVEGALALGRGAGAAMAWAQPARRGVCLGNLRAAFGPDRPVEELEAISRGVFQQIGMSFIEVLRTPAIDRAYVDRWVTIEGRHHFDQAVATGRGAVLVTGHFGNWELTNLTAGLHGYPLSVLARMQGFPRLNALLNTYRESKGCRVITKGMAVRAMVRHLRQGGLVGILADQDAGRRGVLAPFFGRLASTAEGPIALAVQMGCPVLPVCILRGEGPRHTLVIEPPLPIPSTDRPEADIHAGVAAYLQVLERYIRRAPAQWLWPHRRWKSSPHRAVVVLSDGKAGHRTQAEAAAELVEQVWTERTANDPRLHGLTGPWTQRHVIEMRYRSRWHRAGLAAAEALGITAWRPAWRWLRWALTPESHQALERRWATVTISAGAATGLINLVWSRGIGAKTVHLMRPPWPFARRFGLRIVPRHDRVREDAHTVVTRGALHLVTPERLQTAGEGPRRRWSLTRPLQIGCLLGGDSREARLSPALMETVIEQLLAAAGQLDAELLVTTSRRTSSGAEAVVERRLGAHPRCPLLVVASRDGRAGYVPEILAVAQVIVVSGESMSMVSEAVASGKPVLVFAPAATRPWPKHRRFLTSLAAEGIVQVVPPTQLASQVVAAARQGPTAPVIDDRAVVLAKLRQRL